MDPYADGTRRLQPIAFDGRAGGPPAPAKPIHPEPAPWVAGARDRR